MRVSQTLILIPVFGQVLLTFVVLILMGVARHRCLAQSNRTMQDIALATATDWDEQARKCANNYANQFELPVLFFVVCAFALATRMVDIWMLGLAVCFVATRLVHTIVHLTSNVVMWRGLAFIAGFVILAAMWGLLMSRIIHAGF